MHPHNVLIVGAGPTGLSLAAELSHRGVDSILLIDSNQSPVPQTKASVLWPRSLELLSNWPGVLQDAHSRGVKMSNVVLRGPNENNLIAKFSLGHRFHSAFEYALLLEQWFTEEIITRFLARKKVAVTRSTELVSYSYSNDADYPIEAVLKKSTGQETVKVKYLIGCDGGKSLVRHLIGCGFKGEVLDGTVYSCHFRCKKPVSDIDNTALTLFLKKQGMSFITPMPENTYMSALDFRGSQLQGLLSEQKDKHGQLLPKELSFETAEKVLQERLSPYIQLEKILWHTHFRVNERLTSKYWDGKRVFLAGDACHAHSPLGGQGMNTGIQEAINLGWKLALVLQNKCSEELLTSYSAERLQIGKNLVDHTKSSHTMSAIRDPYFQFIRNRIISLVTSQEAILEIFAQIQGETIYNYRSCPISAEHWQKPALIPNMLLRRNQNILRMLTTRVHAGDRVSPHMLTCVESNFFSATTGFKLIFFQGLPSDKLLGDLSLDQLNLVGDQLIQQTNGFVSAYTVVPSEYMDSTVSFGVRGQCVFVIRPDGHVGLRCEAVSIEVVQAYLRDRVGVTQWAESGLQRGSTRKFQPLVNDWVHAVVLVAIAGAVAYARGWYVPKWYTSK